MPSFLPVVLLHTFLHGQCALKRSSEPQVTLASQLSECPCCGHVNLVTLELGAFTLSHHIPGSWVTISPNSSRAFRQPSVSNPLLTLWVITLWGLPKVHLQVPFPTPCSPQSSCLCPLSHVRWFCPWTSLFLHPHYPLLTLLTLVRGPAPTCHCTGTIFRLCMGPRGIYVLSPCGGPALWPWPRTPSIPVLWESWETPAWSTSTSQRGWIQGLQSSRRPLVNQGEKDGAWARQAEQEGPGVLGWAAPVGSGCLPAAQSSSTCPVLPCPPVFLDLLLTL